MKTASYVQTFENLFLAILSGIWRAVRILNPRPLQQHFAARPPSGVYIEIGKVFNAEMADAGQSICRVANNLIKSETNPKGIFERNQLIKVYNPQNKHFAVLYVMGAGRHGISRNAISIDYDARRALGIAKECKGEGTVELVAGPANVGDSEYFHMYTDHEKSSRNQRCVGWVITAVGLAWSAVAIVMPAFSGLIDLISQL
jgi:hypothetical protein